MFIEKSENKNELQREVQCAVNYSSRSYKEDQNITIFNNSSSDDKLETPANSGETITVGEVDFSTGNVDTASNGNSIGKTSPKSFRDFGKVKIFYIRRNEKW